MQNTNKKLTFLSILLLKQLTTLNAKLAKDSEYPAAHETYCPPGFEGAKLLTATADDTIQGIESLTGLSVCQKMKLKSHYCNHIYTAPAVARLHKFYKVKVAGVRYS